MTFVDGTSDRDLPFDVFHFARRRMVNDPPASVRLRAERILAEPEQYKLLARVRAIDTCADVRRIATFITTAGEHRMEAVAG